MFEFRWGLFGQMRPSYGHACAIGVALIWVILLHLWSDSVWIDLTSGQSWSRFVCGIKRIWSNTLLGDVQCSIPAVQSILVLLSVLSTRISTLSLCHSVRCDARGEGKGHFSITAAQPLPGAECSLTTSHTRRWKITFLVEIAGRAQWVYLGCNAMRVWTSSCRRCSGIHNVMSSPAAAPAALWSVPSQWAVIPSPEWCPLTVLFDGSCRQLLHLKKKEMLQVLSCCRSHSGMRSPSHPKAAAWSVIFKPHRRSVKNVLFHASSLKKIYPCVMFLRCFLIISLSSCCLHCNAVWKWLWKQHKVLFLQGFAFLLCWVL